LAPPALRAETWNLVEKVKNAGLRQMLLTNDGTVLLTICPSIVMEAEAVGMLSYRFDTSDPDATDSRS